MSELKNRIDSQRQILKMVNDQKWPAEPLIGLTKNSIQRWLDKNLISSESEISKILYFASEKLFFLANKSQEQITDEYILLSQEITDIIHRIERVIEKSFNRIS